MPYMQTDLQKIMGHQFSEEKIQYLIYQVLKGLKVSSVAKTLGNCLNLKDLLKKLINFPFQYILKEGIELLTNYPLCKTNTYAISVL